MPTLFENILSMFGALAGPLGSAFGPIGTAAGSIAGIVSTEIVNLINAHAAGNAVSSDYLSALGALQVAVAALQAETNIPPAVLTEINVVDADLQAAFKGYIAAESGFNPALYAPPAPVS